MKLLTILLFCSTMLFGQQTVTFKYLKGYKYKTKTVEVKYNSGDSLDEKHRVIVDAVSSQLGKKVGNKMCGSLLVHAMIALGKPDYKPKSHSYNPDDVEQIKLRDVVPGDWVLMENMEIEAGKVYSHIAMVYKIENGVIWTLEQNIGGSPVVMRKLSAMIYSGDYTYLRIK